MFIHISIITIAPSEFFFFVIFETSSLGCLNACLHIPRQCLGGFFGELRKFLTQAKPHFFHIQQNKSRPDNNLGCIYKSNTMLGDVVVRR
jgi:hypothetical protein